VTDAATDASPTADLLDLESFTSALLGDDDAADLPLDEIDPAIHYQLPSPDRSADAGAESDTVHTAAAIAERIAEADAELLAAQELRQQQQQEDEDEEQESKTDHPMRALLWFRRDLRLHDNLALHTALKRMAEASGAPATLIPLYIAHRPRIMLCGANRFQFMLESVSDLAESLAARGSRLVIARGDGEAVLKRLLPAWGITHLFFDASSEPFAIARDERIIALAQRLGVRVEVTRGYTLYDLNAVLACNKGKPPKTYTSFLRTVSLFPAPAKPLPTRESLPALNKLPSELYQQLVDYWSSNGGGRASSSSEMDVDDDSDVAALLETVAGPDRGFAVPELTEFGFEQPETHPFIYGGEQIALRILDEYCKTEARVVRFEKPKTSPAETRPSSSTTSLSPFMYFGCMSPRTFYHRVHEIQERHKKASSAPPVSLDGQLLWREFFHCHGRANPYFDKMEENPLCLQIDWRWHSIPENEADMTDDDKLARAQFEAWKEGQTGYPWIDAIMLQLKQEGWMHHLARHSVACFLTRGDLYISWVRGLEVFQERLIDHDWNINAGNWLWLSSSAFFTAYFRVYSPSTFGKKWDPEGNFIRKYVPVLAKMPAKYIYEPWKAPVTVQRTAGCLVGKDYPFPIVDHKIALRRCLGGMKASYAAGEHGVLPPSPSPPASPRPKRPRENSASSSSSDGSAAGRTSAKV
jgi:cryptochrome